MRCRIDFKYALGFDLGDPGFQHIVLSDFRDRLLQGGRPDRLLDLVLARWKKARLVRERATQRTDSTHVLAVVRDLPRLEPVTEAVRAGAGPARSGTNAPPPATPLAPQAFPPRTLRTPVTRPSRPVGPGLAQALRGPVRH
ncbi:transposase [Streptomyces sp. QTS52]